MDVTKSKIHERGEIQNKLKSFRVYGATVAIGTGVSDCGMAESCSDGASDNGMTIAMGIVSDCWSGATAGCAVFIWVTGDVVDAGLTCISWTGTIGVSTG